MSIAKSKRASVDPILSRVLQCISRPEGLFAAYLLLALMAFPILEILSSGSQATQYAHDVFDEGVVSRLGAIAPDWNQFGFSLWNPYLTCGNARLSQFAISPFSLDALISLIAGPFLAYSIVYFLMIFVAGWSMHLFLRDSMGLTPLASFSGGIIYMFSFWQYIGLAVPATPLMLWLFDKADSNPRRKVAYLSGFILLIGFLFYNSHSQLTLLLAVLQFAYVLATTSTVAQVLPRISTLCLAWFIGILLAAPVLLTQIVLLPQSHRTLWKSNVPRTYLELRTTVVQTLRVYSSTIIGVPTYKGLGGTGGVQGTFYLGLIGLPLLVVNLLTFVKTRKEWFFLGCLVAVPIADLLAATVFQPVQQHLGFLKSFQLDRVRHFLPFLLATNAAVGLSILQVRGSMQITETFLRKAAWILLFLTIPLQVAITSYQLLYSDANGLIAQIKFAGWLIALLYMAVGLILWIWLFVAFGKQQTPGVPVRAIMFCLILLLVDRMVYARVERWIDAENLGSYEQSLGATPAVSYLKSVLNNDYHRVLSVGSHANVMMYHRIFAVDGYENIYPIRYHELFGLLTAPYLEKDPIRYKYFHEWGNRAYTFGRDVDHDLANLMGIRWFYAENTVLDDPSLNEVFSEGNTKIYENLNVLPRAYLVHQVRAFSDRQQLLSALGEATTQALFTQSYLLEADMPGLNLTAPTDTPKDRVTITLYEPDRSIIEVDTESNGILVLTDVNAPGWVCRVNGKEADILNVFNAFRGVGLKAGHSLVEFEYIPKYTYAGLGLATFGILAMFILCMLLKRHAVSLKGK